MLVPLPPFCPNGNVIFTQHWAEDQTRAITHEWRGGRVLRVAAILCPPLPFDPVGSRITVEGIRLRVLWRHFEMNVYDCVPDDGLAHIEVAITRLCEALGAAERGIVRFLLRRGWANTEQGSAFQWRDVLPFALARWH